MEAFLKARECGKRFMEEGALEAWDEMLTGSMMEIICENIMKQKQRFGGDLAVAYATPTRRQRDFIRKCLGSSSLVFVVLNMSRECQEKRLKARHAIEGDEEDVKFLTKLFDFYEKPGEGEPDAVNVCVSDVMTVQDVVEEVLHKISLV